MNVHICYRNTCEQLRNAKMKVNAVSGNTCELLGNAKMKVNAFTETGAIMLTV